MFFRKKNKTKNEKSKEYSGREPISSPASLQKVESIIKEHMQGSHDLVIQYIDKYNKRIAIFYVKELIDAPSMNQNLMKALIELKQQKIDIRLIKESIPSIFIEETKDLSNIILKLIRGFTYIHVDGEEGGILTNFSQQKERTVTKAENETNIFGPQIAFNENLATNTAIVRQLITSPMLKVEEMMVGKISQTKINIIYIQGVANEEYVNTLKQRINDIEYDGILFSPVLTEMISDNTLSIFPQFRLTELPDLFSGSIMEGKIGVLVDGSTYGFTAPSTFINFFQTGQDYYSKWNKASFMRLLRISSMILSIYFTAVYVAALTYHYEIIPSAVLIQLGQTRAKVPFPPLMEALFLEMTLELLREAGARLPTKVGQTMGIVGGIVIGQAAVQAGFTSNILIIIVALTALGSYTSPCYYMGNSVRILRFPMIILAGLLGGLGIVYGTSILILHLLKLKSLGSPFLYPFYPLKIKEFRDSMIRLPYNTNYHRTGYARPKDKGRFNKLRSHMIKDIDE